MRRSTASAFDRHFIDGTTSKAWNIWEQYQNLSQKKKISLWVTLDCKWTRWHLKRLWTWRWKICPILWREIQMRLFVSLFNYPANLCLMSWVVHLEYAIGILNYLRTFTIELFLPVSKSEATPTRCLKITEKVSFNIASEASYVYILSGQKLNKNAKNGPFWRVFENRKLVVK